MVFCNVTLTEQEIDEDPLFKGHNLKFHHLGLLISASFGLIAVVIAFWLIFSHATHYLKPWEQKQYGPLAPLEGFAPGCIHGLI